MKKIIIILGILMCFNLTGCTSTDSGSKDYDIHSHLIAIEGENDLYYYSTTHIVYVVFNEIAGCRGYGYMAPYYSENGRLCMYDVKAKEIIELEDK